jgi:arylsulfatase A-like enzyme
MSIFGNAPPITELDARDATAPPRFEVTAPKDAPNAVIVLIDDIEFGTARSFGGPIDSPSLGRLANESLGDNRFHTTAGMCSATRMSLLIRRNHHTANAGEVMEISTAFPGHTKKGRKSF